MLSHVADKRKVFGDHLVGHRMIDSLLGSDGGDLGLGRDWEAYTHFLRSTGSFRT